MPFGWWFGVSGGAVVADANRMRMSYILESVIGTTPVGNLTDFRFTGESLGMESPTKDSEEIRYDRQTADVVRTESKTGGGINGEFICGVHDDLLLGALCAAAWSSPVTMTASTIAASGANTFTDSANGFVSAGFQVGQWIKTTLFSNAANNGYFRITAVAAGTLTVAGNTATVVEAAGSSHTIVMGAQIVNSTTLNSFSIEKQFMDLTNIFTIMKGQCIDGASMKISSGNIISFDTTWIGMTEASATATAGSGYTTANTNNVMESIDHVVGPLEGGAAAGTIGILDFSWQLANNLRGRMQVGSVAPVSIGMGSVGCKGTLRMYFASQTIANKFRNFTSTSLALAIVDSVASKSYVFELPQIKYTSFKHVAGGKDTDIIADLGWSAKRDPTTGITMRVARW